MDGVLVLLIAGVPIALAVFLGVQGLKVYGFVDATSAPKAAIWIAVVFGAMSLVGQLYPPALPIVELVFTTFLGVMTAGLFYEYIAAPFLEKLGIGMSSEDLNK